MGVLTINGVDDGLLKKLRDRAEAAGRSPEEEARTILNATLREPFSKEVEPEQERRALIIGAMQEFRKRTYRPGGPTSLELLHEGRADRMRRLTGEELYPET